MQDADLFTKHPPNNEQRLDQYGQLGEVIDELLDPRLKLDRPDHAHLETEVAQARLGESAEQPLRQRPSLQSNPFEMVGGIRQHLQQTVGFARHLHFPCDPARISHNADSRLLDRHISSSKMVHAALLLLMPDAAYADLVSPSA